MKVLSWYQKDKLLGLNKMSLKIPLQILMNERKRMQRKLLKSTSLEGQTSDSMKRRKRICLTTIQKRKVASMMR